MGSRSPGSLPISRAVDAVVVLSDRLAERIRALALELEVVRLRQPIATERFVPGAPLPNRPRRALLLGNYLQGDRRAALVEAWERAGVQCSQLGSPTRSELEVLPAIAAADIVVAKGRAALEAMSCARAVYLYDQFGGDGWVTPENYPALEADGFGGLATPAPRTPQDLTGDLAAYRPSMGWVTNELVRTHHGVRRHVAKLLGALRAPGRGERPAPDALQEISRVERLRWRADMRADAAWRDYRTAWHPACSRRPGRWAAHLIESGGGDERAAVCIRQSARTSRGSRGGRSGRCRNRPLGHDLLRRSDRIRRGHRAGNRARASTAD